MIIIEKMKTIDGKEQKLLLLSILLDITSFCEKNNIRYFLAYGTLIGSIRHKGFIPWDDDIDLIMPRKDYETFLLMYNGTNEHYEVLTYKRNRDYHIDFAKVHDRRTILQEEYSVKTNYGLFVDIFPYDGYTGKKQYYLGIIMARMLHYKTMAWYKNNSIIKNLIIQMVKCSLSILSFKKLLELMEKNARKASFDASKEVYYVSSYLKFHGPYRKEIFENALWGEFEGHLFRIPCGYDELLKVQYGDYMQLPPKSERINKHQAKVWWK